ncbi:MAG: acylphosphatase [Nodosilinea sp.]
MALPIRSETSDLKTSRQLSEARVETGELVRVSGTVQGVGFRPMVYRLATALGLGGEVYNDGQGVLIRLWGPQCQIDQLVNRLPEDLPPLARVTQIERYPLAGVQAASSHFRILDSQMTPVNTAVAADGASCGDCLADIGDRQCRFFRYPFTNCTRCGHGSVSSSTFPTIAPIRPWPGFPSAPPVGQNTRIRASAVSMPSP